MRGIILCGGLGTRLRPLTNRYSKVMIPIAGKPLLEYNIRLLKKHGIDQIAINLCYLGEQIIDYFSDGKKFGVKINYLEEEELSGTAGPVKKLADFWDDDFLVFYGDHLTDINLTELIDFHQKKGGLATIVLYKTDHPWNKGIVELDKKGRITSFIEKPKPGTTKSRLANSGIYIFQKKVLDYIPEGKFSDFGFDIFPTLLKKKEKLFGFISDNYILDVGTIETYQQAQKDFKEGKLSLDKNL